MGNNIYYTIDISKKLQSVNWDRDKSIKSKYWKFRTTVVLIKVKITRITATKCESMFKGWSRFGEVEFAWKSKYS